MSEEHVWYVSYGSNMCADRLACYLRGGRPEGGRRTYSGARDHAPPSDSRPTTLPGSVFFAGRSRNWGGGMAFYDHDVSGPTPARAYLITVEQFADVAAQESDREPVVGGPVEAVLRDRSALTAVGDTRVVDDGLYARLIRVGTIDSVPSLTFTSAHGVDGMPHTMPSDPYLAVIGRGLHETYGWDRESVTAYLHGLSPVHAMPRSAERDPADAHGN